MPKRRLGKVNSGKGFASRSAGTHTLCGSSGSASNVRRTADHFGDLSGAVGPEATLPLIFGSVSV